MTWKNLLASFVIVLLFVGTVSFAADFDGPHYLKKSGDAINPFVSTDELGKTDLRWAKGWFDAVDTTNLTVTLITAETIVGGNIDMSGNYIDNALYVQAGHFNATNTAATTTIAGGFIVDDGVLFVDPYDNQIG
ncbi:unnamed protein product, partial [marine sediment metagenome]